MSEPNWKRIKTDSELREKLMTRGKILAEIRRFFLKQDFVEVETPVVVAHFGMEPHLNPFTTTLKDITKKEHSAFLITSPEYSLKKLLAGGLEKVFEITKCFRNSEPWGRQHNPEFTMIEWYRAGSDYTDLMSDTENLVSTVAQSILGKKQAVWSGTKIDFSVSWPRLSVAEAFQKYAGIDLLAGIDNSEKFKSDAIEKGIEIKESDTFDDIFFKIFLRDIEPRLGMPSEEGEPARPVILYDYPKSMAALARLKKEDGRLAERFEVYCCGIELCNAFSELTDAKEQRRRLEEEQSERRRLNKPVLEIDEQFLEAVSMMPESSGIAFGIDRLVMLLTDSRDIRDVLFFPAEDLF